MNSTSLFLLLWTSGCRFKSKIKDTLHTIDIPIITVKSAGIHIINIVDVRIKYKSNLWRKRYQKIISKNI